MVPAERESLWTPPEGAAQPTRVALERFQRAVAGDPRIAAAFIGGSFATGTWDQHSDLDLYLIADEADYDEVFADRRSFLDAMGPVVLAEDFDGFGFDMVVFLLADGVEGELGLGRSSGFSHLHGGSFAVLVDRRGMLEGVTFDFLGPERSQRVASVPRTVAWFWRQLSLFATAAARGRAWTAYGYLQLARREALDLVWWLEAPGVWPGGFEKLEQYVGNGMAEPIAATLVGLDLDAQLVASRALADLVAELGPVACRDVGCEYPEALEATVRQKLRPVA